MNDFYGWNKIDLHSHTINEITRDRKTPKSNYTHKLFYEYVKHQGVSVKAVTNHNTLNLEDHVKHALICSLLNVNYVPGVEIDYLLEEGSKPFHAISILSPRTDVITFSKALSDIVQEKMNTVSNIELDKHDFAWVHASTEFIFIPHATKDKGIFDKKQSSFEDEHNINWLAESIASGMSMPIILENTRDYHSYSVTEKLIHAIKQDEIKFSPVYALFTDYTFDGDKDREQMIERKKPYYIYAEPTYRGLELSIRHHESRFSREDKILRRDNYIKEISINESSNFTKTTLHLSPSLNVIIGKSGSGKTMLLNELHYKLSGKPCLQSVDGRKESEKNKGKSPYHKITKGEDFITINYEKSIKSPSVLEVPKVYSAILNHKDIQGIKDTLSLDSYEDGSAIMNSYKSNVAYYENLVNAMNNLSFEGNQIFKNIENAIVFLQNNVIEDKLYNINQEVYDNRYKEKLNREIVAINKYINEEETYIKHFRGMEQYLSKETVYSLDEFIKTYKTLLEDLKNEHRKRAKELKNETFQEKLHKTINLAIQNTNSHLGQKQRSVTERAKTKSSQDLELVKTVTSLLKNEAEQEEIQLDFPYQEVLTTIDKQQFDEESEFIKIKFDCTEDDLKNLKLDSSDLVDSKNIKTKLSNLNTYDFLNSEAVKRCVKCLKEQEIRLSDILKGNLQTNIYFRIEGEWRAKEKINPGTLSIKFTEYYFNKLIRDKQPDIILIDQPENDIDKEFISNTLTRFIKEQKVNSQIIMTTHDPILAVNADANSIILSQMLDVNKLKYESMKMESIDEQTHGFVGTDIVSKILDGGKANIKLRYQVYGGILNE